MWLPDGASISYVNSAGTPGLSVTLVLGNRLLREPGKNKELINVWCLFLPATPVEVLVCRLSFHYNSVIYLFFVCFNEIIKHFKLYTKIIIIIIIIYYNTTLHLYISIVSLATLLDPQHRMYYITGTRILGINTVQCYRECLTYCYFLLQAY